MKAICYLLPKIHEVTYTQYFTLHFSHVHRLPEAYLDTWPISRGQLLVIFTDCCQVGLRAHCLGREPLVVRFRLLPAGGGCLREPLGGGAFQAEPERKGRREWESDFRWRS